MFPFQADFDYLLKMPIYSLTLEQKEKLLQEKGTIEAEYDTLAKKSEMDLWLEDLDSLEAKLKELEKIESDNRKASNKRAAGGKSKMKGAVSLEPSADGEYIEAIVTADMEKKALAQERTKAAKKEPKVKKEPKAKAAPKAKAEPKAKKEVKTEKYDRKGYRNPHKIM